MRLLVNDCLTCIPGTRTFWHDLMEWFGMEFRGGDYATLAESVDTTGASLLIRNASWFPPIKAGCPQIALLQDIMEGPGREMQVEVMKSCRATVFNSNFTHSKYQLGLDEGMIKAYGQWPDGAINRMFVIPLPVDFNLFRPGNPIGLQRELDIPPKSVCWVGAWNGPAGQIKGFETFLQVARLNPHRWFIGVFKDSVPPSVPPNVRCFEKLAQEELCRVMGACAVGLCTSVMESQHLAGIEMGAVGLPLVVPPVGTYWKREDVPGVLVGEPKPEAYMAGIEQMLTVERKPGLIRTYWQKEFDKEVVKEQWTKLIEEVEEVECSGAS